LAVALATLYEAISPGKGGSEKHFRYPAFRSGLNVTVYFADLLAVLEIA
jgi:hypothetical protein